MKNTILNKIIRFCLRRCCIDTMTATMAIHQLSQGEIQCYLNEYEKTRAYWKTHKNPYKKVLTKD